MASNSAFERFNSASAAKTSRRCLTLTNSAFAVANKVSDSRKSRTGKSISDCLTLVSAANTSRWLLALVKSAFAWAKWA